MALRSKRKGPNIMTTGMNEYDSYFAPVDESIRKLIIQKHKELGSNWDFNYVWRKEKISGNFAPRPPGELAPRLPSEDVELRQVDALTWQDLNISGGGKIS